MLGSPVDCFFPLLSSLPLEVAECCVCPTLARTHARKSSWLLWASSRSCLFWLRVHISLERSAIGLGFEDRRKQGSTHLDSLVGNHLSVPSGERFVLVVLPTCQFSIISVAVAAESNVYPRIQVLNPNRYVGAYRLYCKACSWVCGYWSFSPLQLTETILHASEAGSLILFCLARRV